MNQSHVRYNHYKRLYTLFCNIYPEFYSGEKWLFLKIPLVQTRRIDDWWKITYNIIFFTCENNLYGRPADEIITLWKLENT
jgi:hypothetical protein